MFRLAHFYDLKKAVSIPGFLAREMVRELKVQDWHLIICFSLLGYQFF